MKELSYVMVKPGFANDQAIIDEVKKRLTSVGLEIKEEGFVNYTPEDSKVHYSAHVSKPFYGELEEYLISDKAYGMIVEGEDAIVEIRKLVGSKNLEPGTIRFDILNSLGLIKFNDDGTKSFNITKNVVHATGEKGEEVAEIALFKKLLARENSMQK
ncbi:MAG: hypothetical protein IKB06_03970 [Clostridia bacterium]|nr:hypothetical protein [Clostridia bacterium]MBR2391632.1 hypothetical protein [Clostridia bacterium]